MYIKKGYSPLGYKFGDYASLGIFAGKTFFKRLGVTLQLKGEWIDSMRYTKNIDMVATYGIYVSSTGSKKISLVPQLSFSYKNFTLFALKEFPLFEYVNGVQMKTQTVITAGIAYRFFTVQSKIPKDGEGVYTCPMNCEGGASNKPGNCRVCGMKLEKKQ
jgi:hypothetical protein